jgi:hypothetical protein
MAMAAVGQHDKIVNTLKGVETPTDVRALVAVGVALVLTVVAILVEEKC